MELFRLIRVGDVDKIAQYLKDKGDTLDYNMKNDRGQTLLYWACESKSPSIAKLLIDGGANINMEEKYGFTPLHLASFLGNMNVVKLLVAGAADVNKTNNSLSTPLHLAAKEGHIDVVKHLVESGANITTKDEKGRDPLSYAKTPEIQKVLQDELIKFDQTETKNALPASDSDTLNEIQSLKQLATTLQEKLSIESERMKELKNKLDEEQTKSQFKCLICKKSNRDTVVVPCMHFLFCWECVKNMGDNCYTCKIDIEGILQCKTSV
eukprot:TRINITY_DN8660_c0_g1_i2.p2 TRINITY_DN8660_c0_g1~~TRINITY_DN8660_c0_g1_i2.p2  ORF type:complete len:266 (+),score=47.05 TRINITY_DN8660_c0_g1_i2:30-827(+)